MTWKRSKQSKELANTKPENKSDDNVKKQQWAKSQLAFEEWRS